jgi:hypothetical protein
MKDVKATGEASSPPKRTSSNSTGTAGTVIFCLSGTGTGMHYCSGPGKIKNERPTFWEIMFLLTMKRQDFVKKARCWKTAKYCLDTKPKLEPEPEIKTGTGAGT